MARLRTHHLHVTGLGSPYWLRLVAFRDHLRCHTDDAAAYVELKRELAARYRDEPRRYTSGKHAFVTAVERMAGISGDADDPPICHSRREAGRQRPATQLH